MNKLTIRANVLMLEGTTRTLKLTESHNMRRIPYGGQHIDSSRNHLNTELVPLGLLSLHDKVLSIVRSRGIDTDHYSLKKKNRGFGVEFVFSVTDGFSCDFYSLYTDCIDWLKDYYPESEVAHAVIHFDEKTPHLHVVLVPIVNGKLQADKVRDFKKANIRAMSLFEYLDPSYGLSIPVFLKGAAKKRGAEKAITIYRALPDEKIRGMLDKAIIQAIHARPEPFMVGMGMSLRVAYYGEQHNSNIKES